ncbi:hypothetical protein LOD75_07130 [Xylella fastidiosa subsp. multiplex]|uniref:hypothetical protein n=1 Tax=Xylella fastidiosa TaxID=2371 RepID=UPI00187CEE84|nr:hypothetical protein [Xylella fastidiosa]MDD0909706.1 hypothetical protein [Xylella fastidiosa subsp. multiplex]UIT47070.1 hypothetical protein LZ754_07730 [Xylella fastidiosa subsp. multiplex]
MNAKKSHYLYEVTLHNVQSGHQDKIDIKKMRQSSMTAAACGAQKAQPAPDGSRPSVIKKRLLNDSPGRLFTHSSKVTYTLI